MAKAIPRLVHFNREYLLVKDRAVGYSGLVSPLHGKFVLHLGCKRVCSGIVPYHAHIYAHEYVTIVLHLCYKYHCH